MRMPADVRRSCNSKQAIVRRTETSAEHVVDCDAAALQAPCTMQPFLLCNTDSSTLTRGVLMNALATVGMPLLPMLTSALTSRLSNLTATLDSSTPALCVQHCGQGRDRQSAHKSCGRLGLSVYAVSNRLAASAAGQRNWQLETTHEPEERVVGCAHLSSRCLTFLSSSSLSCSCVSSASSSSARRSSGSTC